MMGSGHWRTLRWIAIAIVFSHILLLELSEVTSAVISDAQVTTAASISQDLQQGEDDKDAGSTEDDPDEDESNEVIPRGLQKLFNEEVQKFDAPQYIKTSFPYYLSGFDDDNQPIWVIEFGRFGLREWVEAGGKNFTLLDTYLNQMVFRMLESTRLKHTDEMPVNQANVIADLDGYELNQLRSSATIQYIITKLKQWLEAFRRLNAGICLNANFVAESLINLVKPILGREFEKIHVYGTNKAKWLPKFLRIIPKDQVAEWYGGNKDFKPVKVYG